MYVFFKSEVSQNHLNLPKYKYFYRPQTKFAKVMFLQMSVCPQRGRAWLGACMVLGGHVWLWGACMVAGGHAWLLGGVCGCWGACMVVGGHVWLQGGMHGCGGCVVAGGMCGEGGHAWWRRHAWWGGHVWQRGGCMAKGACVGYDGKWAGGTHPTGMHSCLD